MANANVRLESSADAARLSLPNPLAIGDVTALQFPGSTTIVRRAMVPGRPMEAARQNAGSQLDYKNAVVSQSLRWKLRRSLTAAKRALMPDRTKVAAPAFEASPG